MAATDADIRTAGRVCAVLWRTWLQHLPAAAFHHAPAAFDPEWARQLMHPGVAPGPAQTVALIRGDQFSRTRAAPRGEAESLDGRTRLYEGVDRLTGGWFEVCARQLGALARCPVTASVYESSPGDDGLPPHTDAWHGLVVQIEGIKRWTVFSDRTEQTHDVSAGDVLYVPTRVQHSVATVRRSVHAVFELITQDVQGPG